MSLLLAALAVLMSGGILSLHPRLGARAGVAGCLAGAALGIVPAVRVLCGGPTLAWRMDWSIPGGSIYLHCDPLSAFFLIPILLVPALAAVYGVEYMHGKAPRAHWFFYSFLVAGMAMVVLAWNAIFFLVAWETMALASFFLVVTDDEDEKVREAGWIYLVATHCGTACLMVMFALAGQASESLDFDHIAGHASPGWAAAIFVLAIIGFGTKAGIAPFHVWLPEAHPAAPSHVSAVMSGVMIKTGIYGIVRVLMQSGTPPLWVGWTLIVLGLISGIGGVLFALAQQDLKRMLAYSSVENIGIILMGLGLGAVGWMTGDERVCLLGFAAALLHVLNHSLLKSLLFLAVGAMAHATGSRDLNQLGGLFKRMRWTGSAFLMGSTAIAGLPPFNGFVGELLLFLGSLMAIMSAQTGLCGAGAAVMVGLALISGLAVACFTRAFGTAYLGEHRSGSAALAKDPGWKMLLPMGVLVYSCLAVVLFGNLLLVPFEDIDNRHFFLDTILFLVRSASAFLVFTNVCLALAFVRRRLLRRRTVRQAVTWDCGYAAPAVRMQYSASSFAQPLVEMFRSVLWTRTAGERVDGYFPETQPFETETVDMLRARFYHPFFSGLLRGMAVARRLQHGNVHLYVLYIAAVLLFLLLWELG